MSATATCPRQTRARIESTFSTLHQKHLGETPPTVHPRVVDLVWRLSRGRLGKIRSVSGRVVREAATRGFSHVDLGVVANRWGR